MKAKHERYIKLRYWMLESPAWKSIPGEAQTLYLQVVRRYNGSNNGRISFSVREAAAVLNVSRGHAKYLFDMLQDRRFIVCTKRGAFSLKTTKDASLWRLTEFDSDYPVQHASKDFMRWTGEPETVSQFRARSEGGREMTPSDAHRIKTRFTVMNQTVHSHEPRGSQS
jgi:hypothetical protein